MRASLRILRAFCCVSNCVLSVDVKTWKCTLYFKNTTFADNNDQSQSKNFAFDLKYSIIDMFEGVFERSINQFMYIYDTTLRIKNYIFRYNKHRYALFWIKYSDCYIDNTEFYNNNAMAYSSLYFTNCSFKNNYNVYNDKNHHT